MAENNELPESLVKAAEAHNWPLDLVQDGLKSGATPEMLENIINSGVSPEQARERMQARAQGGGPPPGFPPPLDMGWAKAPTQRGMRPKIGAEGLTLALADSGPYGDAPDHWPYENDTPRGAYVPPNMVGLPASYSIYDKAEVWADNCADLYEEAIRNRWASSTDIPWEKLEPLPAHIEQSICQLCTNWSEDAHVGFETIAAWLEKISYGYHEVKLYLATQVFDLARHTEAFRKRALANGGALGVQRPGTMHRAISASLKFTELVIDLSVLRTSFMLTLLQRFGDKLARSDADRELFRLVSRDLERHLAYGMEHLRYFLLRQPEKRGQVQAWLARAELMMVSEIRRNVPYNEALVLLLDDSPKVGAAKLLALRRMQVEEYLERLAQVTLTEHRDNLAGTLKYYLGDHDPVEAFVSSAL